KGHKIVVVAEKHQEGLMSEEKVEGIEVYRIPDLKENWSKKFQIWKWTWENIELIKKADIVHCHDVFFWYLPFRFLYLKKPVYTTFHGYEDYPLRLKFILMHKIAEKLSMGNICVGEFMKKWYGTRPNFVSYGGVDKTNSEKFPPKADQPMPEKVESSKGAVFIGRLDEQTGIKIYADAVKLIKKKIPNFEFKIIGDGKFRKEIEKDFKVLGFRKDSKKYFSKYHFAFVSRYLSILEAMAAKRLVFAVSDNPLKEDYLKMAPFAKLINIINSENELAKRIIYFLKNSKEKEKMVNKAYEWAITKTWKNVAKQYLLLWKQPL
ncbi:MAG: glycosyltransferase family 4 protein, partial [Patescibacteria group bacterium]